MRTIARIRVRFKMLPILRYLRKRKSIIPDEKTRAFSLFFVISEKNKKLKRKKIIKKKKTRNLFEGGTKKR